MLVLYHITICTLFKKEGKEEMAIRDQSVELCPVVIADQVRELAANLHFEVFSRTSDFTLGMFERISTQVEQFKQQYEGELVDRRTFGTRLAS